MNKKIRKTHYRQVQTVWLGTGTNAERLVEDYEYLGYHTKVKGDTLHLFWGTKPKKADKPKDDEDKPKRRSKTERRLGRKFSRNES